MTDALMTTDRLFFDGPDATLARDDAERILGETLAGADDGELFLEYREHEAISLDDGVIRNATFDASAGFGLRCVAGTEQGFAHSGEMTEAALRRAGEAAAAAKRGRSGTAADGPAATNRRLYGEGNPVEEGRFSDRAALLGELDAYARGKDAAVVQVSASLGADWQAVQIIRADGTRVADLRPMVRLHVSVVVERDGKRESGGHGTGGRAAYGMVLDAAVWRGAVDEALRQARVRLDARPAPAGEMEVVLGAGWPGILLHEAIGHGLEGDFHRKETSVFTGLRGRIIASEDVTVVDDGTIPDRRGSITVDDEGTPSGRTVLIERGRFTAVMQDRLNARLMGERPTGNGRRQSYAHAPMPRMTNTMMLAGTASPDEMIRSVRRGLYAVNFAGGQVDITSGKFVFSTSEAYLIEDGVVTAPVKGATLIGNGADALTKISMVGADPALDPGIGNCGKQGQWVPVGVGQPHVKMTGLTVGGTSAG